MATEKTDVVIVGVGAVGGILAAELGKAGMKVIGLERGPRLSTADFNPHDELRYFQRQELRPNWKRQPKSSSSRSRDEEDTPPPCSSEDGAMGLVAASTGVSLPDDTGKITCAVAAPAEAAKAVFSS